MIVPMIATILSLPFWFIAFIFVTCGVLGTVKVNGIPYYGEHLLVVKACLVVFGLSNGLIAYALVSLT